MKRFLKKIFNLNENEDNRNRWLQETLTQLPAGLRILDAGAGELKNKIHCTHLHYVSQDFCQYEGSGDKKGLQTGTWDTSRIDIVGDISAIPEKDASFDVILCSEVFEHLPNALLALKEFSRLLKPGGKLISTAPFASLVHFAPYHYSTGFSKYWYLTHFPANGFQIIELTPNGDWFNFSKQEIFRLPKMARSSGDWCWPLAYFVAGVGALYFMIRNTGKKSDDLATLGWFCIAVKNG